MKIISSILLSAGLLVCMSHQASSQGCVAIRGNTGCGTNVGSSLNLMKGDLSVQTGYRYFKSFRHFRGDHEETHRLDEGTEVINRSSFLDFSVNYGLTDRWYLNAIIPFVYHTRSSMYEHGGNPPNGLGERHTTSSYGLSDIRIGAGYWLFDPQKHSFNYALGIGLKLPTGKYDYTDTFYNQGDNRDQNVESVVDQSIQPGDGGLGIALDLQGYHPISSHLGVSTSLYYLINFWETNGVATRRGTSEFSCADQYAARIGGLYNIPGGFNAYLGARIEGVPSEDLIGGNAGYRRPGFAISAEPGLGYAIGGFSFFASVPVALYRNRTRSYQDIQRTQQTGRYRHGDAAFADYLINVGVSYRFSEHGTSAIDTPIMDH
ncbi:MAG: transporter [Saprospiraceae bacterium]|nr:transporter [Saprospiraceae bacterium]